MASRKRSRAGARGKLKPVARRKAKPSRPARKKSKRQRAARQGSPTRASVRQRSASRSRIARVEQSLRTLGERRVKAGPITVARTSRLTPTKAGFRALKRTLAQVQKSQGTRTRPNLFTMSLNVRFRGPDGRFRAWPPKGAQADARFSLPLPQAVKRRRRKGETAAQTFQRLVEEQIRRAVHRVGMEAGGADEEKRYRAFHAARQAGHWKQARRLLARYKADRAVSFSLKVYREVP